MIDKTDPYTASSAPGNGSSHGDSHATGSSGSSRSDGGFQSMGDPVDEALDYLHGLADMVRELWQLEQAKLQAAFQQFIWGAAAIAAAAVAALFALAGFVFFLLRGCVLALEAIGLPSAAANLTVGAVPLLGLTAAYFVLRNRSRRRRLAELKRKFSPLESPRMERTEDDESWPLH